MRVASDDRMSVGVEEIDADHRMLVRLVNDVAAAVGDGADRTDALLRIERLLAFTADHFAHEEALMEQTAYPGADTHKVAHHRLLQQGHRYEIEYSMGTAPAPHVFARSLNEWLLDHVSTLDFDLGQHIGGWRAEHVG